MIPRPTLPSPLTYPAVEPVPEGVDRPFWSVMIPTLNRPDFLRKALQSVLDEGYGPDEMQICVVDNASTVGDIKAIVDELGGGRVEYFRQPSFSEITVNWNSCITLSRGYWVQLLHDDSAVLPGFYKAIKHNIDTYNTSMIFSQVIAVDKDNNWHGISKRVPVTDGLIDHPLQIVTRDNVFMGNTMMVHRDHYENVDGYYNGIFYGCDQEITARLILDAERIGFLPRPYAVAPIHTGQSSHQFWISPGFRESDLFTWEMLISHNDTPQFRQEVYHFLSEVLYNTTQRLKASGHFRSALRQSIWAYRLNPTTRTLWNIPGIFLARIQVINRRLRPIKRVQRLVNGIINQTQRLLQPHDG